MPCEHPATQGNTLGSLHSLSPNMWWVQHFQLLEDGNAVSCLTSVLICAGMLTNSGFEANAVRFSTASINGAVAVLHLLRFSSEKSPSRAWKWDQGWALPEQVSLAKWKEDGWSLPSFKPLHVEGIWKLLHKQDWCNECDFLWVSFLSWLLTLHLRLLQVFCHCTLINLSGLSLMRLKSLKCPRTSHSKGWKG